MMQIQGISGSPLPDEIAHRYGLMRPPELTAEIASRRWREINRLMHACMVLHGMGRDRRPFQRLLRTAGSLVGAGRGIFYVRIDGQSALEMAAFSGFLNGVPERFRSANDLASATLLAGKPVLVNRPTEIRLQEDFRILGESCSVCFPILREGQPWGVVQLLRSEPFSEEEAVLLWMYGLVVEDALPSLAHVGRCQEAMTPRAPQAGLVSLSVFETRLEWELECVLWGGRSCTLLRLSYDAGSSPEGSSERFKQAKVLRVVRSCLRSHDLLAIDGSDNLLVFLPELDSLEGQQIAQKLRRTLVQSRILGEESAVIHALRIAQATCPDQGRRRDELLASMESRN